MTNQDAKPMPDHVAAIVSCGFAAWADKAAVDPKLRARFDSVKIPVVGVRNERVWGLQVDDERELPGHERTSIPDEELWQVVLVATDGSHYEVNSELVEPAPE